MVRSMFSLTDLLFVCLVWGTWLQGNTTAYQGGCRQVKFLHPEKESHLKGHVFRNLTIARHTSCEDRCLMESECVSINIGPSVSEKVVCELSNSDHFQNQEDLKSRNGWTYRGTENFCSLYKPCLNNATCVMGYTDKRYHCECAPGYEGEHCEKVETIGQSSSNPGISCKHIRESTVSRGNGEYWIDPEQNGNPLKVFCDMTTDGGGWLLVANIIFSVSVYNSSLDWASDQTYREISNYASNQMGISKGALNKLRTHLSFTQIRFHCRKEQGRTFHVITAANSTGEAVVQYFTGRTSILPASCGSFQRMDDDNSQLSMTCDQWGYDGAYYVGKWGHHRKQGRDRMYNHAAFIPFKYYWVIVNGAWLCDDGGNNTLTKSSGDFWKIYVR